MNNAVNKETPADIVERLSHTEVHIRLLRAMKNFPVINGTGKGAYKDDKGNWIVIASKADIKRCTVKPLADEGLIGYFSQDVSKCNDNSIVFKYQLLHADSGQAKEWYIKMPTSKGTFWDYGSAQTYAYRYLLGDIFNLTILDDVETIDQDAVSAQLNLMYKNFTTDMSNVKTENDLKQCKEKTHKQFLKYIKDYKQTEYIKKASEIVHLTEARIAGE